MRRLPHLRDALPVPPPPGETRSLYQVFFGTPMGGLPSAPLPVTVPNDQNLEPGEKAEIWYYDAAPIPGVPAGWRLAGLGTVSGDGSRVVSDPGVGISRFCGVCGVFCIIKNFFTQPSVNPHGPKDGEPVDLGSGVMVVDKTDLVLPGRLPAVLRRSYNPHDAFGQVIIGRRRRVRFNTDAIVGVLMVVLGIVSLVFRRALVRWQSDLFWPHRAPSPEFTRSRETLQLVVGVVFLLLGLAFVFDFF